MARPRLRYLQKHGLGVRRLEIGDTTTPVSPPGYILPSAAPTGTAQIGDYYMGTDGIFRYHNGNAFTQPGAVRVIKTAAATLTPADTGALCLFNLAAGFTYTLPTAAAGLWFEFLVTVSVTSVTAKIITASASEFLLGGFTQIPDTAAQIVVHTANGSTIRAWNGNGTTTGGLIGDVVRVVAISATQWAISGYGLATGSEATPFATS